MGAQHAKVVEAGFRSDAGRALAGGGGIVPDVVLRRDTLSAAEQRFARAFEGQVAVFRDVLTAYALEVRNSSRVADPAFVITDEMRKGIRHRLEARGLAVADSTFDAGERILGEQLGYEIARYRFGQDAERLRRVREDPQVREAVSLLRSAPNPQALLGMATPAASQAH